MSYHLGTKNCCQWMSILTLVCEFSCSISHELESHVQLASNLEEAVIKYPRRLRVDWILQVDICLWKSLRMNLKNLIIKTLVADQNLKKVFGTES
jgi:hypothetical protein